MLKKIIKRDGSIETFTPDKLNKWSMWASEDLGDRVDWSSVVLEAVKGTEDTIGSQELQNRLVEACVERNTWPYAIMASRLHSAVLRKKMFDGSLPTVKKLHKKLISLGLVRKMNYTDTDYVKIESFIDHTRDFSLAKFQLDYILHKYSIQSRHHKVSYELPQYTFMRMAMALSEDEPEDVKLMHVKNFYDHFSFNRVNAPTPNYVNLGTPHYGLASCCLYAAGDTAPSLAIGDHIAYTMTYMSAGIGGNLMTRSLGDSVREGALSHMGKLPYYAALGKAVRANKQGGRGGAVTSYFSCYDPEAFTITMLQNPRSTEDLKNRDIHFCMLSNMYFAKCVAQNKEIFVFNVKTAPDLDKLFYSEDQEGFENLYLEYENNPKFKKKYVNARALLIKAGLQGYEVATLYYGLIDEMNRNTPFKDTIYSSNLCVSGGTSILTDKGYFKIKDLLDKEVNVWNGEEWSSTTVKKTSDSSKLLRVTTDGGYWLDCTEQHKWYIQDSYHSTKPTEVRTIDLKPGMKLIKFDLPIIDGSEEMTDPYINGFYTGDGCQTKDSQRIYLYHEKRELINEFPGGGNWSIRDKEKRMHKHYTHLHNKYFVPNASFTVSSRLKWLAGYSDADGCIYRNDGNQQLVLTSIKKSFLEELVLMLQTLGAMSSIRVASEEGFKSLPANDGTGEHKEYICKKAYRLIITSNDLQKLLTLGISFKRLIVEEHTPQRDAKHFIQIKEVIDINKYATTYCFTEPKRHMGMFNGILTGQCSEIIEPTAPYENMMDLYSEEDHGRGEIALCSLAGIVVSNIKSDAEYDSAAYYCLKMIDKTIDIADYALPHVGFTAKRRRNAAVGLVGVATEMARADVKYDTVEGRNVLHAIAERHAYFVISNSLKLGQELGNAPWIHKTKWPEGWLPIDTAKRTIDELVTVGNVYPWEELRAKIIANKGIRHSCVIAHMPTESSSKASGVPNCIYPVRYVNMRKSDNGNIIDWCATDGDLLFHQYQSAWTVSELNMIKAYSVVQKFTDHTISADIYVDRSVNIDVDTDTIITTYLAMVKYGLKTRYYVNSNTADAPEDKCSSGSCTL